ncbi:MAG: addiction module toxin RelE [Pseudomonadota bacterium]
MFDASNYMITVAEMGEFEETAAALLTPAEIEGLITFVSQHPDDGEIIPDTGGLRVLNWPACREDSPQVVYLFRDLNMPVYLIALLEPHESLEFTKSDKARMRAKVDEIISAQWDKQVSPLLAAAIKSSA